MEIGFWKTITIHFLHMKKLWHFKLHHCFHILIICCDLPFTALYLESTNVDSRMPYSNWNSITITFNLTIQVTK